MAAFTTFKAESLVQYLIMFDRGELVSYEPITSGIENSNYFVTLRQDDYQSEYVLTISEALDFDEVPFFNDLMLQLIKRGLPVPQPQTTLDGMSSTIFRKKPTWLFDKLDGAHPEKVNTKQCYTIGKALAEFHGAATKARYNRKNPYDPDWVRSTLNAIKPNLAPSDWQLLNEIADQYREFQRDTELPRGIIHGDLFRDNSLFEADELTGIIDLYHACSDFLVQDVAITMNDFCTNSDGSFDDLRREALLEGYESIRSLSVFEQDALIMFQRFSALRFTLTRFLSAKDDGAPLKDPEEFLRVIRHLSE